MFSKIFSSIFFLSLIVDARPVNEGYAMPSEGRAYASVSDEVVVPLKKKEVKKEVKEKEEKPEIIVEKKTNTAPRKTKLAVTESEKKKVVAGFWSAKVQKNFRGKIDKRFHKYMNKSYCKVSNIEVIDGYGIDCPEATEFTYNVDLSCKFPKNTKAEKLEWDYFTYMCSVGSGRVSWQGIEVTAF